MPSQSIRKWLLSIAPLVASAQFLASCGAGAPPAGAAPPDVDVATVVTREIDDWDVFNGRVSALETVEVRPRVTGYIMRVAYPEGSFVRKGDLLFVIDQRPYRAALGSARAQLERARATERNARLQDQRAQKLVVSDATSREDAEERRAAWEQSVADLHAAQSAVASAALNLDFTEVRAPVAGRTSRANLTVGNLAAADQTVLTSVVSQDPVYVYFDPDEQSFLRSRAMGGANTLGAPGPVRVGLANDEGFPFSGTVSFVDNQLDPGTGTIRARAVVPNREGRLTPGLFARVQFAGGGKRPAVLLPDRAILTDQDRKYVYVVGPDRKAVRRDVKTGKAAGGLRVIETGLRTGDRVVVGGLLKIYASGTPVVPHATQLKVADASDGASPSAIASAR